MGRRSEHTKNELAEMILDTAFVMIEKDGIDGISTRKIASDIGYTVGTLYNIFANLDDIFLYVNSRAMDILIQQLDAALKTTSDPELQIEHITNIYINFSKERYNLWHLLFEYRMSETQEIPRWYTKKIAYINNLIIDIIRSFVVRQDYLVYFVGIYWATIHGFCVLQNSGKFKKIGIESSDEMQKLFLKNWINSMA